MGAPKFLSAPEKAGKVEPETRYRTPFPVLFTLFLVTIALVAAVSVAVYYGLLFQRIADGFRHLPKSSADQLYNKTSIANKTFRIIERTEWLAQPALHPALPLKHPVPYVVILHTATDNCSTLAQCTFFVRRTQTFHIESNGWWDIGYSFLVGGDGNAYEGRGWDNTGAFVYGYNNVSIGISFIGNFATQLPPEKQIQAGQRLIEEGVRLGKIARDYKLLAHRQLTATNSPGAAFFENIKTWPHFAEAP